MGANHFNILILGGGTGGLSAAAFIMRNSRKYSVGLVEPSEWHYYQPAWTLVGGGVVPAEATKKPQKDFIPNGVTWIKDKVTKIDPHKRIVTTESGNDLSYDYLIISTGVEYVYDWVPGLREALDTPHASSNYLYDYAPKTWELLRNFKGGKALFTVPHTPYKCGAGPMKIMFLADEVFRKNGVRNKSEVVLYTPGTVYFGVPGFKETITAIADQKGIKGNFLYKLVEVKPDVRGATFEHIETGEKVEEEYDFIHLVPPQAPHSFIRDNKDLVEGAEQPGFLNVDRYTLQHKKFHDIYGVGDVCGVPFAKSGAAIRKHVGKVAKRILAALDGTQYNKTYDGYAGCPFIVGYGKVVMAEFIYDNVPSPSFPRWLLDTRKPSYLMWLLKTKFLPWMYWNKMLRGKMIEA